MTPRPDLPVSSPGFSDVGLWQTSCPSVPVEEVRHVSCSVWRMGRTVGDVRGVWREQVPFVAKSHAESESFKCYGDDHGEWREPQDCSGGGRGPRHIRQQRHTQPHDLFESTPPPYRLSSDQPGESVATPANPPYREPHTCA